jgi:RNase H-fold protein (predicted Holliday junction resolvase)
MFGDSMWDEEERLRRAEEGREETDAAESEAGTEIDDVTAMGVLDERLRRRMAIAELLREVGGC